MAYFAQQLAFLSLCGLCIGAAAPGPPSRLFDVKVEKITATTITFDIHGPQDDGGLPIHDFVVRYHEENKPAVDGQMHEWREGTPYVLENLKPRTGYIFLFAARNEAGIGEYSQKRIVMPSESYPETPKFITPGGNISAYPHRFQIRWTVPLDNGRKIDFFELHYYEVEKQNSEWERIGGHTVVEINDWENAPMYEMENLKANAKYQIEIRAHNEIGFSSMATTVFQTATYGSTLRTGVKTWNGNPVILTCSAESVPNATITWSYLGQEIHNDEVYTVYGNSAHSNLLVHPPLVFSPDGPNIYGTYKCEMINSHAHQHITIDLQEVHPPSSLLDVKIEKITSTTITFDFHGPHDDDGLPIHDFVVRYHEENKLAADGQLHEWREGTPYVLENLEPRTVYKFRFAARNEAGIGEYSEVKRIVMPSEAVPESPKFITPGGNISAYPDRFQIRWTVPLDNGRKIDFFELRYYEVEKQNNEWKRVGSPIVKEISDFEDAPMYEMENLTANTNYEIEVRAHNEIGVSAMATTVFQTSAVCGGKMTATSSAQYIYSHTPFKNKYDNNRNCYWLLLTSGHRLRLHFTVFELEPHSTCDYDYIEIFEGFRSTGQKITRLCGYTIPEDVVSNGPQVLLRFHTDPANNYRGFALTFSEEP